MTTRMTETRLASSAPAVKETMLAMVLDSSRETLKVQAKMAPSSCTSATRLVASISEPRCERSPNLRMVQTTLTMKAKNSSSLS